MKSRIEPGSPEYGPPVCEETNRLKSVNTPINRNMPASGMNIPDREREVVGKRLFELYVRVNRIHILEIRSDRHDVLRREDGARRAGA